MTILLSQSPKLSFLQAPLLFLEGRVLCQPELSQPPASGLSTKAWHLPANQAFAGPMANLLQEIRSL